MAEKEYIEREAVNALIKAECSPKVAAYLIDAVATIPAADVRPVRHGKWVKATGMMPPEYCGLHICSECGHYAGKKPPYGGREMLSDYCPYCGADMRGEQT